MDTDVKQLSRRSFLGGMTATALTAASYKRVLGRTIASASASSDSG